MSKPSFFQTYHSEFSSLFSEQLILVRSIQSTLLSSTLPEIISSIQSSDSQAGIQSTPKDFSQVESILRSFISDPSNIFRFLRKHRFSTNPTLGNLKSALLRLALLAPYEKAEGYLKEDRPLMQFDERWKDKFGRPVVIVRMNKVRRDESGTTEGIKELVGLIWEAGRRLVGKYQEGDEDGNDEGKERKEKGVLQMVLLIDLDGAGTSNFEPELIPFLLDLLRTHYPALVGAIFVLNFNWLQSGKSVYLYQRFS
jgi:hypothetical protein